MMQAFGVRTALAVRNKMAGRVSGGNFQSQAAAAMGSIYCPVGGLRQYQHQQQQQRGLAVDKLQYGIVVKEGMNISDPVKRVLSIDNADRPQQKQVARQLAIQQWQRHPGDTGSPEAQIASLTVRIDALHSHVNKDHRKDFSTKRGYMKLVTRRRKMLQYLKRTDFEIYRKVALETGLR